MGHTPLIRVSADGRAIICTILATLALMLAIAPAAEAKRSHLEKWYQAGWCAEHQGQAEVRLPDGTRADCITATHAVEFDFADKWAEAIGQALFYGLQTGKRPGVVLILENAKDRRFWIRLNSTIQHFRLPIDTWSTGKGAY